MIIDIIKIFQNETINWIDKLCEDEWFFTKLRGRITKDLSPEQAFKLIPKAVSLILKQTDSQLCIEAFELLLELVRISKTTEIHPILLENWYNLISNVSSFSDYHKNRTNELKRYYRKKTNPSGS